MGGSLSLQLAISTLPCIFQTYVTYTQPLRLVLSVSPAIPLVGPYRYAKMGRFRLHYG